MGPPMSTQGHLKDLADKLNRELEQARYRNRARQLRQLLDVIQEAKQTARDSGLPLVILRKTNRVGLPIYEAVAEDMLLHHKFLAEGWQVIARVEPGS